ncbi:MAG: alpha/beta hydrolase, partial [Pleurocapsa sp. SU_196_0]|nr:alpha/beta hydrolase [Pleurocapsa sp. SU_196_0]
MNNWVTDTRFVIAQLRDPTTGALRHADSSRVAIMGHSLGGVVALELGRDPRAGFNAVIDLDGPWLQYGERMRDLQVPALIFASTQNVYAGHDLSLRGTFDLPLSASRRGAHLLEIGGTGHFNFTDLNYLQVVKLFSPVLGGVDGRRMGAWMNTALVNSCGVSTPLMRPSRESRNRCCPNSRVAPCFSAGCAREVRTDWSTGVAGTRRPRRHV